MSVDLDRMYMEFHPWQEESTKRCHSIFPDGEELDKSRVFLDRLGPERSYNKARIPISRPVKLTELKASRRHLRKSVSIINLVLSKAFAW